MSETAAIQGSPEGVDGLVEDWASDKQTYNVPWGKAMMWIFLVSDTFIFTCFLTGYLNVRLTTTEPWPLQTEIFALTLFGQSIPLVLIAIMTFILITSSGSMALAVNFGYRKDKQKTFIAMVITALLGLSFVGMQAFEWTTTGCGSTRRCMSAPTPRRTARERSAEATNCFSTIFGVISPATRSAMRRRVPRSGCDLRQHVGGLIGNLFFGGGLRSD